MTNLFDVIGPWAQEYVIQHDLQHSLDGLSTVDDFEAECRAVAVQVVVRALQRKDIVPSPRSFSSIVSAVRTKHSDVIETEVQKRQAILADLVQSEGS